MKTSSVPLDAFCCLSSASRGWSHALIPMWLCKQLYMAAPDANEIHPWIYTDQTPKDQVEKAIPCQSRVSMIRLLPTEARNVMASPTMLEQTTNRRVHLSSHCPGSLAVTLALEKPPRQLCLTPLFMCLSRNVTPRDVMRAATVLCLPYRINIR